MYRFTLVLVASTAGALLLYGLGRVALVLVMAMFFAYLVAPLVAAAERPLRAVGTPRRISRGLAIGLVYVAISGATWAGAALLLPTVSQQAGEAVSQAPGYAQSLRTWQRGWSRSYERLKLPTELRRRIDQSLLHAGDRVERRVRESVAAGVGLLSYLPWLVLIPVLAFFLLKDAEQDRIRQTERREPQSACCADQCARQELRADVRGQRGVQLLEQPVSPPAEALRKGVEVMSTGCNPNSRIEVQRWTRVPFL